MSKIPNNRLFLEKAAEIFRKKKVDSFPYDPFKPRFRPEDHYTSGHCAEFAYCFAEFAKANGIEPTVTVIFNNQYDRAITGFEDYLQRFPNGIHSINANFYLGQLYYRDGNKDKAAANYRFVADKPKNEFTEQALSRLSEILLENENYSPFNI